MATLMIRGLPDDLDQKIKALATADRRSVNAELAVLLEEAVAARLDELSPDQARAAGLQ